jgi:hypothetical protein
MGTGVRRQEAGARGQGFSVWLRRRGAAASGVGLVRGSVRIAASRRMRPGGESEGAAFVEPLLTQFNGPRRVHVEQPYRGAAGRRETDDRSALQLEVLVPGVFARVEQPDDPARVLVDAREVRTLVGITAVTGKTKPARIIAAAVLPSDCVLDVERNQWSCALGDAAVQSGFKTARMNRVLAD